VQAEYIGVRSQSGVDQVNLGASGQEAHRSLEPLGPQGVSMAKVVLHDAWVIEEIGDRGHGLGFWYTPAVPSFRSLEELKPYYRNPRWDVLVNLPSGVRRALDVGCGAGSFGLLLKSDQGCEVWGIEIEPEPAAFAAERLDRVDVGDAIEVLATYPDAHFDLVTCNDVLEHLAWPDRAVKEIARVLRPGGTLVASLPNLRCWKPFMKIVKEGDFPQDDSGIFDRTHLRWYTKKSIPRLFEGSGLVLQRLEGINPMYSRTLRILNLVTRNRCDDCRFLQFFVLAIKPDQNG